MKKYIKKYAERKDHSCELTAGNNCMYIDDIDWQCPTIDNDVLQCTVDNCVYYEATIFGHAIQHIKNLIRRYV